MKKILLIAILPVLTLSCIVSQVSVSSIGTDTQYYNRNPDFRVQVIDTEYKLNMLLANNFNFRYDYAHYMMRQPKHPARNRMLLNNRYSYYNPYLGYSPHWDTNQMWNDWIWGYSYSYGRRWGHPWSTYYGWNSYYGWNNYYGWYNWNTWDKRLNPNRGRSNTSNSLRTRYITTEVIHGNKNTRRRVHRAPRNVKTTTIIRNTRKRNTRTTPPVRVNTIKPVRRNRSNHNTQNRTTKKNNIRKNQ